MRPPGNIIGSARAETDSAMLAEAFVETADYAALVNTQDFSFVVGRRGTGKSALFQMVSQKFARTKGYFTLASKPEEHQTLELQHHLSEVGKSYREMRAISKLTWKVHILLWCLKPLLEFYKIAGTETRQKLETHYWRHFDLLDDASPGRVASIVREARRDSPSAAELPSKIATRFAIAELQRDVQVALRESKRSVQFFVDGLDEGWTPTEAATAALGGLAAAVADFDEAQSGIHGTLFIRDNMFRALAHFDPDYSRHVESSSLRLHWDEAALFDLVTRRLRVVLDMLDIENAERIWNEFTDEDLQGRRGFDRCLHHTLYRPRDILVLINRAHVLTQRRGDSRLSWPVIEIAAKDISHDRVEDLLKEYDKVLPGMRSFVRAFEGRPAFASVGEIVHHLENEIYDGAYSDVSDSDFALLGSGKQVLAALYGVGFLGYENRSRNAYIFCHDGSGTEPEDVSDELRTVIHPCYWKALEAAADSEVTDVVVQINDEFNGTPKPDIRDMRVRRLGQVLSELPKIPDGPDGASQFEEWVLLAVRLLFAGNLANPELHPSPTGIQRRDVIASNIAERGFWKRIREDYGTRQVMFEVKNYHALRNEDYRQLLSYLSGEYGRFGIVVHRGANEGVSERDRGWLQTLYHEHGRIVLTLPESILQRGISKLRNADRFDYIEDQLLKRMDTFVRRYLSLSHTQRFRKRKKKR